MAEHAATFIEAMGFSSVDLLGFSMSGYVAQVVTLDHLELVRKLVLAGTGPGGGEGTQLPDPTISEVPGRPMLGLEESRYLFFTESEASKAAAERYWERLHRRPDREPPVPAEGYTNMRTAECAWASGDGSAFSRLS